MSGIYIHMGYPKCLSTTLQRSFFEKHSQILYGGIGIGDNISYANEDIEFCFESLLKYANSSSWEREKKRIKDIIRKFIENAEKRKVVFSSEHLSMNFTLQGLDSVEKLKRIDYLFSDSSIEILLVRRSLPELIKSLYKEFVRLGYEKSYKDFLKWILVFKDRNFVADLNFVNKASQIAKYLPNATVTWLDFSEMRKDEFSTSMNKCLSQWLGVKNKYLKIENNNPSLTDLEVDKLRQINSNQPRRESWSQVEPFEKHRNRTVYKYSGLNFEEYDIFSNVLEKRRALADLANFREELVCRNNYGQDELMERVLESINSFSE